MIAIRSDQEEMAEFLLDNGVDHAYMTSVVNLKDTPNGKIFERYDVTCRQLAYDHDMLGVVEIIDGLLGNLFPFIRPNPRNPRFRRPNPPTPTDSSGRSSSDDDADVSSVGAEEEEGSDENGDGDTTTKRKHRRKRKKREVISEVDSGGDSTASASDAGSRSAPVPLSKATTNDDVAIKDNRNIPEPDKITKEPSFKEDGQSVSVKDDSNPGRKETHSVTFVVDDPVQPPRLRLVKPRVGSQSTKSSMIVSRTANQDRRLSAVENSTEEKPLKWRKISTVGSYSRESKSWHVEHTPGQEYVEIIDLRPSSATSVTSSLVSSWSSSLPRSVTHRGSLASSTGDNTSSHQSSGEILPPKLKPEKPVPSYMRTTTSSLTKKRLKPSFVSCYGALDFR
ncbi:hypothetical protein Btru_061438 [Bulinus truncatus]|nr:hypothetical protein Btru_061438 [Bulinus truncatus]